MTQRGLLSLQLATGRNSGFTATPSSEFDGSSSSITMA
jgi:hypothetical protein